MKAIICDKLFDGIDNELKLDWTLLIEKRHIVSAGPSSAIDLPQSADVINTNGLTVIPGLIDCHDHLASFGYEIAVKWGLTEQESHRHLRIASVLKQTLISGYTTVRDAGGLAAGFREAVDEGLVPGPRLLISVGIISPTGGIGEHLSPSGYGTPFKNDPSLPSGVANGPREMRAKVREMVRAGADVIKFAATGGASSAVDLEPKDMLISRDEIDAIVDESHKLGKKVMCHALGGPGLRASIEAGVDSIEHGTFLHENPELLEVMAKRDIFFVPTFTVYKYHQERGTPHGKQRSLDFHNDHILSLSSAIDAGVKVAAGTDSGGWVHGNNAEEIECLVNAGMSPYQAMLSATVRAAECIGRKDLGTLTPGKKADLLFIEGNPLEDVSGLVYGKDVNLVIKNGEVAYTKSVR